MKETARQAEGCLTYMRTAKIQARLRDCIIPLEPSLLAHALYRLRRGLRELEICVHCMAEHLQYYGQIKTCVKHPICTTGFYYIGGIMCQIVYLTAVLCLHLVRYSRIWVETRLPGERMSVDVLPVNYSDSVCLTAL